MSHDDDALLKHVPPELRDQFPRDKPAKPKPAQPAKDEPQDEPQEDYTSFFAQKLIEAHGVWSLAGMPGSGDEADRLVEALVDAYLVSPDNSPIEAEVVQFAQSIGALEVLADGVEAYNATLDVETAKSQYRQDAFRMFEGIPQPVIDAVGDSFDEEFLTSVRDGTIEPDDLRRELATRLETAREIRRSDVVREDLEALDAELLRHGPTDEKGRQEYELELRASTKQQSHYDREAVAERAAIRAGDAPTPEDRSEQLEQEELRRMGAIVDPEDDARRQRWAREAEEHVRANE